MTAGTLLVLLAVWVAMEAWRDWPGPVGLARRLASGRRPARRSHVPGMAGRSGVNLEVTSAQPALEGRIMRSTFGPCDGCGAPEDAWCAPDCDRLDGMDNR